jgi:cytidylate kinase
MSTRVVAIDGPAASGKSSTAAAVARRLGLVHVDSGALYRGVTRVALDLGPGLDPDPILAAAEARGLGLRLREHDTEVVLDGREAEDRIRGADVTAAVSAVSALPAVRQWVNARLRALTLTGRVLVVDGRDIGTAVFPDALVKVFLVAAPEVRARRRLDQRGEPAGPGPVQEEAARIARRDQADSTRVVAPLRPADDAVRLDTSDLSFAGQVDRIVALVRAAGLPEGPEKG